MLCVPNLVVVLATVLITVAVPACLATTGNARCSKWNYYDYPVDVTSNAISASQHARPVSLVDGYPADLSQPEQAPITAAQPTPEEPIFIIIDYRRPVTVTRFVHLANRILNTCGWSDVEILTSEDNEDWVLRQTLTDLPADIGQALCIDKPVCARYYKIVVKSLVPNAPYFATQEIETYSGVTVSSVTALPERVVQSERCSLSVRVVSPEVALRGASLSVVAPKGSIAGETRKALPPLARGGESSVTFELSPVGSGQLPLRIELHSGGSVIDSRLYTLRVEPKLVFGGVSPAEAVFAEAGQSVACEGSLTNSGTTLAKGVKVGWMGKNVDLGNLAPGQSAPFAIKVAAAPGYREGAVTASADGETRTTIRKPVICGIGSGFTAKTSSATSEWSFADGAASISVMPNGAQTPVDGSLRLFVAGKAQALLPVGKEASSRRQLLACAVPGAVLLMRVDTSRPDLALACEVIPNDPCPVATPWLNLELRLAIAEPGVMFRPHIDWYRVEDGPNWPHLQNGHHSATRMLCVQTGGVTLSAVPDTDNMTWGFTADNEMSIHFQVPLAPRDGLNAGIWPSIVESPRQWSITLAARAGDWWDAYRYVVEEIFRLEEPRQWAMPITQMQMLAMRSLMSYAAWSEKWQTVKSFSSDAWFMNFYGAQYTLPAMYSWYLATDDDTARIKSEKIADWLLARQYNEGPMAGAWFSVYFDRGEAGLVGSDFIQNKWLIPQATGGTVRTLLWYWNAGGRQNTRVFEAARSGCDWMLKTLRDDGGWPYAFDAVDGTPITNACGAGQIWCTWSLWDMYRATGEEKYKEAALRSKDFFKRAYMDVHRYVGYWEDTVGITKEQNKTISSWESYEAAVAVHVFSEMGDTALALEAAKDLACHSWTRVTSTRQYETSYGQTIEQSLCGPSQAQSPMVGVSFSEAYRLTGDSLWRDLSGAVKAVNFCADPEQGYGMVATSGWSDALNAVAGPPYENVRPFVSPDSRRGDYGRALWYGWCTDQFAWLALEWLIREGNMRAPQYVTIDHNTLRGTVLGVPGRVKMPEEKCDVNGIDHYDINWVGYQNDDHYVLLVMNHKEKTEVLVRPREAHLGVYTREPRILISDGNAHAQAKVTKRGVQYVVGIPEKGSVMLIWERIR